jgi:hypothetical protein
MKRNVVLLLLVLVAALAFTSFGGDLLPGSGPETIDRGAKAPDAPPPARTEAPGEATPATDPTLFCPPWAAKRA